MSRRHRPGFARRLSAVALAAGATAGGIAFTANAQSIPSVPGLGSVGSVPSLPSIGSSSLSGELGAATGLGSFGAPAGGGFVAPVSAGNRQGLSVAPYAQLTASYTDNARLGTSPVPSEEWVGAATGGLAASARFGRLQGSLAYAATGVHYSRRADADYVTQSLNAAGSLNLIENHLDVQAYAQRGQQAQSAFSTPLGASGTGGSFGAFNPNRTEVTTVGLSTSLRGKIAGVVDAEARLLHTVTDSGTALVGQSTTDAALLRLSGGGRLGWALIALSQQRDPERGRQTQEDRVLGQLSYRFDEDLRVIVGGGRERTDALGALGAAGAVGSTSSTTTTNWQAGVDWTPTPRTRVSAEMADRFFGRSHAVRFEHRFRRSAIQFSDARSLNNGLSSASGSTLTAYELYFQQFASLVPDPAQRQTFVLEFLRNNGIDPNSTPGAGFVSSSPSVQRAQFLGLSWQGLRTTATALASRSDVKRLGPAGVALDDLTLSPRIRQMSYVAALGYRLTPESSLSLSASVQDGAQGQTLQGSGLKALTIGYSTRLGSKTTAALQLRRSQLLPGTSIALGDTRTDETAFVLSLSTQF